MKLTEEHYTNIDKDLTAGWVNEVDYNGLDCVFRWEFKQKWEGFLEKKIWFISMTKYGIGK